MKNRVRALVAATILVGGTVVAGPIGTAVAGDSTCTYDSNNKRVTVSVNPANGQIVIMRSGNEIQLLGPSDCGDATRFNTNKIVVNDPAGHNVEAFVFLGNGALKPGFRNEPGGSDEIEFDFNLNDGSNYFIAQGAPAADYFTAGRPPMALQPVPTKVNLNADEQAGIDADVNVDGNLNSVSMDGFDGPDHLSAQGGAGTGEALLGQVYIDGGNHSDTTFGGDGPDTSYGANGADTLRGMRGPDLLYGEVGPDSLNGGPGSDACDGGPGQNTVVNCEPPAP